MAAPLTWNAALAILKREGVKIHRTAMLRPAGLLNLGGVRIVMLDSASSGRRQLPSLAHEIAHVALDCGEEDDGTAIYYESSVWPDEPREADAIDLAILLTGGPAFAAAVGVVVP